MATITAQEIKTELDEYIKKNDSVISSMVYSEEVQIDKLAKRITSVKGKYPQFHRILTNVVQGFKAEWQELGEAEFRAKVLKNYRQKVNFPIIPDEIYGTWLSDLKIEGKKPQEQPISKMIIEELMAKIIDDLDELSVNGVYDAAHADGEFGKSLDGIESVIAKGKASTTYPMFKIPLNAFTQNNVIDEIEKFYRAIPKKVRKKVTSIVVSEDVLYMYKKAMLDDYGTTTIFNDGMLDKTLIDKVSLTGISGMDDGVIYATVKDNFVKLIDIIDNPPAITDVQVQDYKVKLFFDFHVGYDFLMNHLVFVGVFDGSPRGFNNATLNTRYYKSENLTVTP